jgi:hypothetical protein
MQTCHSFKVHSTFNTQSQLKVHSTGLYELAKIGSIVLLTALTTTCPSR